MKIRLLEWRQAMAYGIYYERYEDMNMKKYESLKMNLIQKEGCRIDSPVCIRKITYQNPKDKKSEGKTIYQIIMKNGDEDHVHLVAQMKTQGQICKKAIWLLKEDCMRILQGDIEWMKEGEEAVLYDFYYQITNEGYQPTEMTESITHIYDFPKQNNSVILKTSQKRSDQEVTKFFAEDWEGREQLKSGRVKVTYRREHTFPQIAMEILNLTKNPEIRYV